MLRIVLWLAAGCVVLMGVLLVSRQMGEPPERAVVAPVAVKAAVAPVAPKAAVVAPVAAPLPKAPPVDPQIADDAAAVGMTTREPEPETAPQ